MKREILDLLLAADDAQASECPDGFDRDGALERVMRVRCSLEKMLGRSLVLEDEMQDASFFADLFLQAPGEPPSRSDRLVALRFSCFGDLFSIWSCLDACLAEDTRRQVVEAAEAHGFRFVPFEALDEPYTGPNDAIRRTEAPTWWYRFFDYL